MISLKVTINEKGGFYKAFYEGKRINKEQLFKLLKIQSYEGRTLQYHLDKFQDENVNFKVEYDEIDVS